MNGKQIMTKEVFNEAILKLKEDQEKLNNLLTQLYQITEYEKVDGVVIRVSKIKLIKEVIDCLKDSIESCECMIDKYILSETQKLQIDEYLEKFTNSLMWFVTTK